MLDGCVMCFRWDVEVGERRVGAGRLSAQAICWPYFGKRANPTSMSPGRLSETLVNVNASPPEYPPFTPILYLAAKSRNPHAKNPTLFTTFTSSVAFYKKRRGRGVRGTPCYHATSQETAKSTPANRPIETSSLIKTSIAIL